MKNWFLHHMHLTILADATLHIILFLLTFGVLMYTAKFIRMTWHHPNATKTTRALSLSAIPVVIGMVISANFSFWYCLNHYAEWWNR